MERYRRLSLMERLGLSKRNHKGQPAKDRDDAVIGVPAKVRAARDERKRK